MTREEAINEINKVFEPAFANYIITALIEGATVSDIQHRWGRAYETGVKDGLEQEPKWIPVTERLPKDGGDYLVTLSFDVGGKEPAREIRKDFYCILSKKWLYDNDDVTAWMPLPQPYKAESEGTNENVMD